MSKPKDLSWVPSDSITAIAEPIPAKKTSGFLNNERPPFEHFNWLFNLIAKWVNYLHAEGNQFAPHEALTPDMTVVIDAGRLPTLTGVLQVVQQTSALIVAPTTNPRIDRIAINYATGALVIITGTPAASPVAPSYTSNYYRIGKILIPVGTTAILSTMITDERMTNDIRGGGQVLSHLSTVPPITTGTGAAYVVSWGISAFETSRVYECTIHLTNTGNAATITADTAGSPSITLINGNSLYAGALQAGQVARFRYTGAGLNLLNPHVFQAESRAVSGKLPDMTGAVNAYTILAGIQAVALGYIYRAIVNITNTGPSSLTIDATAAGTILLPNGNNIIAGDMIAGVSAEFYRNNINYILLNPQASFMARANHTGTQPSSTISDVAALLSRANHTGTQLLSTIFDAGPIAALSSIAQGNISGGAVGQAQLKTATAAGSVLVGTGPGIGTYALVGGTYSFYTMSSDFTIGQTTATCFAGGNTAAGVIGVANASTVNANFYFDERYIQACPPYDLGDGEIGLFIFAIMGSSGEIESFSVSPDPTWAYHGPTNIADAYYRDGKGYREVRQVESDIYNGIYNISGIQKNTKKMLQYADRLMTDPIVEMEITQKIKNRDKELHPHPWHRNDLDGKTVVMLDPVSDLSHKLLALHCAGFDIDRELIKPGNIVVDNTAIKRACPSCVMPVAFKIR